MSNPLAQERERIKALLVDAGLHAFTFLPERITPPFAFVGPREPYVTVTDAPFSTHIVNNQVILVAGKGTNEVAADELDQMIIDTLAALDDGFQTGDVDQPGRINISGLGEFLAVTIGVSNEIDLGAEA